MDAVKREAVAPPAFRVRSVDAYPALALRASYGVNDSITAPRLARLNPASTLSGEGHLPQKPVEMLKCFYI